MAKTRTQIVTEALEECGVTPIGQASEAPEFARVVRVFDNVLAELQAREIAAWDTDTTPDEVAGALSILVAQRAASRVATSEREAALKALGRQPYLDVVALSARKWDGEPITGEYF